MNTQHIKVTTRPPNKPPGILAALITTLIIFNVLPKVWSQTPLYWTGNAPNPAVAVSGTWATAQFTAALWSTTSTSPPTVSWTDGDVAHFVGSAAVTATLGSNISAAGINFDPGANSVTIDTKGNQLNGKTLTINGPGIVNNSGMTQTITNNGSEEQLPVSGAGQILAPGSTSFINASTAGDTAITNNGGTVSGGGGGSTEFFNGSTAGSAAITNNASTVNGGFGGGVYFFDSSTAGKATITNNGGAFSFASGGGFTAFTSNSTAGSATIINNGGTASGVSCGFTEFLNASTAGDAAITNNASAVSGANGGTTEFESTSTAGNAAITNNASAVRGANGGFTEFFNASTAGNATITNNGSTVSGGGGETEFFDNSTAGSATIITNGGTGGGLGGRTVFTGSSDGGTARAITNGNGSFDISGLTTAGMRIGSIEGSGNYFLGSKTLTVGGNNLSTTVSGVIQDGGLSGGAAGSLTKIGTGTLTLTGKNTYTGTTTINAGSLIVDGSIASQQTFVNAGAVLRGHGSLGGSLVNSGIVSPGDSPGTLTVNRDYTENVGGTLRIEVAGLAPTQHDLLAVNGRATLAGTLQLISLGGFILHVGDQVTFLTANGGVSGSFSAVQNQITTGTPVKAEIVELPNAVVLEGLQGSFVPSACNPNAVAVARTLDSAAANPRASTLITFLDSQPLDRLCSDFGLISPEEQASIFNIGVSLANVQTANLMRRMDDIQAGSTGFSAAGFTLNGNTPGLNGGFAGVAGPEGKSGPSVMAPTPENRWGVWVTGVGEFTSIDSTENAAGYYIETGGVNLGIDYRVCSNFAIGFTTGYAHTNTSLDNGGDIDVDVGTFGLYATAFENGFYLDTAVTGGPNGYNTHRTALFGSANGNTDGGEFNVLVAGGYDWKMGGLSIGPTANFQYTYVGFTAFTESGSLAPLQFPSQNAESERTAFGMKASYDWKVGRVVILPEISLAWQHEYGDQSYAIVSSLASGAGASFTVNSPQVGRDSLLIGAGAAVQLNERISIYAYYDGELGRTNYQSNSVSAGIRITF
ncbi:MAG TPA: autotransporter domain-containing protein [Candidatus Acidoferrum sp.]|nr:autotransporter domain-containing protein [Candidatus Acidoferrum sp.]